MYPVKQVQSARIHKPKRAKKVVVTEKGKTMYPQRKVHTSEQDLISDTVNTQVREESLSSANESITDQIPNFDDWCDNWYEEYKTQVQPSTYSIYKYTLRILKEYFGSQRLDTIKTRHVNRFYDYLLGSNLSKSYITKCRAMLKQVMRAAVANELISKNPTEDAKALRIVCTDYAEQMKLNCTGKDAFTLTEQEKIRSAAGEDMMGNSIMLMLGSGMRTQELLALKPTDIAEDGSSVMIVKAMKLVNGMPVIGPTKSKRSNRIIPIPEGYRAYGVYLKNHPAGQYIWASRQAGGLCRPCTFRRQYYRFIKKLDGVRPLPPHCCRHTYVSNLEHCGIPMEQIARLAGHSEIQTTDGYLHMSTEMLSGAVSALDKMPTKSVR